MRSWGNLHEMLTISGIYNAGAVECVYEPLVLLISKPPEIWPIKNTWAKPACLQEEPLLVILVRCCFEVITGFFGEILGAKLLQNHLRLKQDGWKWAKYGDFKVTLFNQTRLVGLFSFHSACTWVFKIHTDTHIHTHTAASDVGQIIMCSISAHSAAVSVAGHRDMDGGGQNKKKQNRKRCIIGQAVR